MAFLNVSFIFSTKPVSCTSSSMAALSAYMRGLDQSVRESVELLGCFISALFKAVFCSFY